jgi:hypothetical protein
MSYIFYDYIIDVQKFDNSGTEEICNMFTNYQTNVSKCHYCETKDSYKNSDCGTPYHLHINKCTLCQYCCHCHVLNDLDNKNDYLHGTYQQKAVIVHNYYEQIRKN